MEDKEKGQVVQETEVDVEIEDTKDLSEEESIENEEEVVDEDVENTEEGNEETKDDVSDEEKQKRAHFAEKKRQQKKQRQETNSQAEEVDIDKATINTFTNLPIESEADKKEFGLMLEAQKNGVDPTDYVQLAKYKKEQEKLVKEAEAKEQEFHVKDFAEFGEKHSEVDLEALGKDKLFNVISKGRIGKDKLVDIYADYLSVKEDLKSNAEDAKNEALARARASAGAVKKSLAETTDNSDAWMDNAKSVKEWLKN